MSPQRAVDAANTHPYPFVVRQERLPPDNADRERNGKPKKYKPRPRAERNPRQEEEIRFNTGPRNLRGAPVNRGSRRPFRMLGRYDRGYNDHNGIPDYPPPSFQEAMTTPLHSACSSTTTLVPISIPTVLIPEDIPEIPEISVAPPNIDTSNEAVISDHGSNSDESLQIIDKNSVVCSDDLPKGVELEQRIRSDWKIRRGHDFPGSSYPDSLQTRGNILDAARVSDRPMSAHPCSSPYATSSRNIFFRSSINLGSPSMIKLPLFPAKNDNSFARKLFGKRKEKLETWEILDDDNYPDEFEAEGDYPSSLMSAAQSLKLTPSFIVGNSPARSQSLNVGIRPPASAQACKNQSPNSPQDGAMRKEQSSPARLSAFLRDRKGPSCALLDRQLWRLPTSVTTGAVSSVKAPLGADSPPATPISSIMHSQVPSPTPAPPVFKNAVPPIHPSPLRLTDTTGDQASASTIYQQALDTPLPATPVRTEFDAVKGAVSPRSVPNLLNDSISAGNPCTCRSAPTLSLGAGNAQINFMEEPITPNRRHYTGRPLPRPPPSTTRSNIDSTFAPVSIYNADAECHPSARCPEGLLIDLDDTSARRRERLLIDLDDTSLDGSNPSTPLSDFRSKLTTTPSFSVADSGSQHFAPLDSTIRGSSPATSDVNRPLELTEFDLLDSRIAYGEDNDFDHEVSSGHSEWPPSPTHTQILFPPQPQATVAQANAETDISLISQIEVKCR